jgi:hypothetical protein|eukprot:COSAG02_NODE_7237_length_3101_cov_3.440373_1_plen_151_part_00
MLQRIASHLQATATATQQEQPRQLLIPAGAAAATTGPPLLATDVIPEVITEAHSLPLSAGVRHLTNAETAQFREDGFITGLPLFAEAAVPHLQGKALEMFEQLEREAPGTRVDKVRAQHSCTTCSSCSRRTTEEGPTARAANEHGALQLR